MLEMSSRGSGIFELKNISKEFAGVQALKDVDLKLIEGEIHAVIGENGAGKSTLMKILVGLLQPSAGEILHHGKSVRIADPLHAQRLGLGIVPQELNLVPHLTVAENMMMGLLPASVGGGLVNWQATYARSQHELNRIGANINPKSRIETLSAAKQQLVQIGRTIGLGAKVIIFDEPTASLSLTEANKLLDIIQTLKAEGHAIVYISHRLEEIMRVADVVTVMRNGAVVKELQPSEFSEQSFVFHMSGRSDLGAIPVAQKQVNASNDIVLKVENFSREGEFEAISFDLRKGEILGLTGLVGAGRTELARCIYGETKGSGNLYLNGKRIKIQNPSRAIKHGIAYVPEERKRDGIFPELSVAENITIGSMSKLSSWGLLNDAKRLELTQQQIKQLAIKTTGPAQKIKNLSGGNQQKAVLSRWLLKGCSILLLDEPTRGIDVNAKFEIHALLRRLAQNGLAILVISSEFKEVIDLADRILIMHEGRLKGEIDARQATQEEILTIAMRDAKASISV